MFISRRGERGAAAVEFALVLPILLMLIGGTIDFGRLYYQQIQLSNAARDGVRLASMGSTYSTSAVQAQVVLAAKPLPVGTANVTVTACTGSPAIATVTVVPTTAFKWSVLGFVPGLPVPNPSGKATMTCP
jgi:Flp pilus assembly protein TadG